MKNISKIAGIKIWILSAFALNMLAGCVDVIDFETAPGPKQLVVDGWLNNQPGPQTITLNWSAGYFDSSVAKPVLGAEVTVSDNKGKVYKFEDLVGNGQYVWGKTNADTMGYIGRTYSLKVVNGADIYTAKSELKRVPPVDSVAYRAATTTTSTTTLYYEARFYARDIEGVGDTYWIKPLVNGKVGAAIASNISIAYDAASDAGIPSDGLLFNKQLRESISAEGPYPAETKVGVELHSITHEAFEFIKQVLEQGSNNGIFATPIANVRSNITNLDPKGPKALGFFCTSAVSRKETIIDPKKAHDE